jgi:hypothetical protein
MIQKSSVTDTPQTVSWSMTGNRWHAKEPPANTDDQIKPEISEDRYDAADDDGKYDLWFRRKALEKRNQDCFTNAQSGRCARCQ